MLRCRPARRLGLIVCGVMVINVLVTTMFRTPWIWTLATPEEVTQVTVRAPAWTDRSSGGPGRAPLQLDVLTLAHDFVGAVVACAVMGTLGYLWLRSRLRRRNCCLHCGHQLAPKQDRCPECFTIAVRSPSGVDLLQPEQNR